MEISLLTGLEIFTNPADLEFCVAQENESHKYALSISRGPGHNFKPLISTTPFAETPEGAVRTVRRILDAIQWTMITELRKNSDSLMSEFLLAGAKELDWSKVLNLDLVNSIEENLKQSGVARTYHL